MPDTPRVLCLGGGYVSMWAVRHLRRAIRRGEVDVTVVDANNYHTFHGLVPEMLVGKIQPGQIISPARRLFAPATFHNAEVESIDLARREVVTSRSLDGKQQTLAYDHLIVGLGSVDDLSRYPGIAEHAMKLKQFWDCLRVRNHVLSMLEMAELEPDEAERRRLLTFVVAGGNFAGVEVASELIEHLHALTRREYPRVSRAEIRVALVHSGERVLPELEARHRPLVDYAMQHLKKQGLDLRLKTRLQAATAEEAILNDGTRLPTRTIISCTGTAQSPLLGQLGCERDERGRVLVEADLRLKGYDNVWAGGDCASVPHPKGGAAPPLAIFAMTAGRQIARNILRTLRRQPLERYSFTGLGDACVLGGRRAVGHVKGVRVTGFVAWLAWRGFMIKYLPTWDRRLRTMSDWLLGPLVGRDVVRLNQLETMGMQPMLFEPGQEIVREGEVGRSLYLIRSGEVEVVKATADGGEEVVGVLGPGSHFGEIAVFSNAKRTATVRARTRTQLLGIRREEAQVLSDTMRQFGERVRELPSVGRAASDSTTSAS